MATANLPAETNATASLQLMAAGRQLILMLALAASVALGVVGAMWSWTPNYSLLYGSLGGKDATEVMNALQQSGISFRVDDQSGAVLVPSSKVNEARIKLAAAGLPKSSAGGYEILNEAPSFGTSRFLEQARFQRAREVELGRSIATMNNIASARVHLASPPRSAFVRGGNRGSASVVVKLHPGRRMEEGQAWTIAHLIAAAMPGMEVGDIRVINDKGHLLNAPGSDDALAPNNQELGYRQRVEKSYLKKISEILNPFVGLDGFRAQVALDMDFTRSERTRESFNPDLPAVESRQIVEQRDGSGASGGIPGALSNQPPSAGTAPEQAGGADASESSAGTKNFRREEIVNHRLDRTISHTRAAAGIVRRVSVAVVLDDQSITSKGGKIQREAWSAEGLESVTELVKDAIGFDLSRGDSIKVINNRFIQPPAQEPLPEIPIWKQPWVWDLGKQASGVIFVLFLVFGVLRPMMRNLSSRAAATSVAVVADAGAGAAGEPGAEGGVAGQEGVSPGIQALPGPSGMGQQTLDAAKAVVTEDPKRVASVVKTWVSEGG